MRINIKTLRRLAEQCGYEGDTNDAPAMKAFLAGVEGFDLTDENGKSVNIKTVYITWDGGEEVVTGEMPESETPVEGESADEDMPPEDEQKGASAERIKRLERDLKIAKAKAERATAPVLAVTAGLGMKAGSLANISASKSYNRKAAQGLTVFPDAEVAERFAAKTRLAIAKGRDYGQRDRDIEIVGKSTLITNNNALGGALIDDDYRAQLIELKESVSAARQFIGVTSMSGDTMTLPRLTGDVTISLLSEASAVTETNPTFDNVEVVARKTGGLVPVSFEQMNDSAIGVADIVARSFGRAFANAEDDDVFNGDGTSTYHKIVGFKNYLGAGSKVTASGNLFSEFTLADFEACIGLIPEFDAALGEPAWVMHKSVFFKTADRLIRAAGGNTEDVLRNSRSGFQLLGYPVIFCQKMPKTDANSQIAAYFGYGNAAAKCGEKYGGMRLDTDESYGFASDTIYVRAIEHFGCTVHEGSDASEPGPVVALVSAGS